MLLPRPAWQIGQEGIFGEEMARAEVQSGKMSVGLERVRSNVAGAEASGPCRGPWREESLEGQTGQGAGT